MSDSYLNLKGLQHFLSKLDERFYSISNPSGYTSNTGTVTSVSAGTGLSISGTASTTPKVNIDSSYKLPTTTEWNGKANTADLPQVTFSPDALPGGTSVRGITVGTDKYNFSSGSVTSVALTVPTGLSVTGSPITTSGTLAISFTNGYSIPTTTKQAEWDAKYTKPSGGIPASDLAVSYVPLSGGTMTGKLQVNALIFGYNYTNGNNRASFMFDKPGSNYTGIGAHAESDTIYFAACNASGEWIDTYKQKWKFNGTIIEDGTSLADKYLGKTATAADSTKLNGQAASYYLNYNNFTNTPDIPTTFTGTQGTVSVSGTPSGTVSLTANDFTATGRITYVQEVSALSKTTKYMKATTTAASTGTVGISGGSISKTTKYLAASTTSSSSTTSSISGTTNVASTSHTHGVTGTVDLGSNTTATSGIAYISSVSGGSAVSPTTKYMKFNAGTTPPSSASPSHTSTNTGNDSGNGTSVASSSHTHTVTVSGTTGNNSGTGISVITGITAGSGSLTSNDTASGGIAYIASASHTAASLGTASTGTVTISNGSYSLSGSRGTSGSGTTARRTLTLSLSGSAPSLGGTTTFVTGYPNFSGGSASHTTKYLHHTHTSASASGGGTAAPNAHTHSYGSSTALTTGAPGGTTPTSTVASHSHTHTYDKTTSVSLTAGTAPSMNFNTNTSTDTPYISAVSGGSAVSATTKYFHPTFSNGSASATTSTAATVASSTHTHNVTANVSVSISASDSSDDGPAYLQDISYTAPTLTGTKTFNTDAIKAVSLSASSTSTDGPTYIESVSGASPTTKYLSASFTGSSTPSTGNFTPQGTIS